MIAVDGADGFLRRRHTGKPEEAEAAEVIEPAAETKPLIYEDFITP
jgi:hypothetical protein